MIGFTFLAVQVILWQSNDISVSIVSETEEGNNEVTISVLNTAGATLLFYENSEVSGKIEYLSDKGWVEYCDVSYTASNADAVSAQYGGTFAELEPGEGWDVNVPEDKIAGMKDGTYRIKMTYITEKNYKQYLDNAFENRNTDSKKEVSHISDEILDKSTVIDMIPVVGEKSEDEETDEIVEETFLGESVCEIFVKTFEYAAPEDYVGEISIDDNDINNGKTSKARINQLN